MDNTHLKAAAKFYIQRTKDPIAIVAFVALALGVFQAKTSTQRKVHFYWALLELLALAWMTNKAKSKEDIEGYAEDAFDSIYENGGYDGFVKELDELSEAMEKDSHYCHMLMPDFNILRKLEPFFYQHHRERLEYRKLVAAKKEAV